MQRRDFISQTCLACGAVAGGGMLLSLLESCSGLPRITASSGKADYTFPAINFGTGNVLVVQRPDAEFDALVVKNEDGTYHTLEMKCSHRNQPLTASRTGLYCASHGSRFSLAGEAQVEPAIEPLNKFRTELSGENIIIHFKPSDRS